QRGQDADLHVHTAARSADRRDDKGRRVLGKPGNAHRAAHSLGDRLVALVVAVGAVGAEALDRRIDEARVDPGERLVAEAEPVERSGTEILQEYVRLGDHLLEEALAL